MRQQCVPTSSVSREQHGGHEAAAAFREDDDVWDVLQICSPIPERGTTRCHVQEVAAWGSWRTGLQTAGAGMCIQPFQSAVAVRDATRTIATMLLGGLHDGKS